MLNGLESLDSTWGVWLAAGQAAYFALTGIWPIVHIRSFMAVTGPKQDIWLVKTLGALITAVSLPMALAAARSAIPPEVVLLAAGSAAALGGADVYYVVRRVIPPISLLDAAIEALLVAAWMLLVLSG